MISHNKIIIDVETEVFYKENGLNGLINIIFDYHKNNEINSMYLVQENIKTGIIKQTKLNFKLEDKYIDNLNIFTLFNKELFNTWKYDIVLTKDTIKIKLIIIIK